MSLSCLQSVKRGTNKERPIPSSIYVIGTSCTDRSGSMSVMGKAVFDGMEAFLDTQKECANKEKRQENTYWRHVTFDTTKQVVYDGGDDTHGNLCESSIEPNDLIPRNMTRIYDTVIEEIDILFKKRKEIQNSLSKQEKLLGVQVMAFFTLLTDGQDNKSSPKSNIKMKEMIENARKDGVVCTFLGANQDAEYVGPSYGFSCGNSLTFSTNAPVDGDSNDTGIYNALRSASSNVSRACSGGGGDSIPFSGLQRTSSQPRDYLPQKKKNIEIFSTREIRLRFRFRFR
jgi:hypothetical protein